MMHLMCYRVVVMTWVVHDNPNVHQSEWFLVGDPPANGVHANAYIDIFFPRKISKAYKEPTVTFSKSGYNITFMIHFNNIHRLFSYLWTVRMHSKDGIICIFILILYQLKQLLVTKYAQFTLQAK